MSLRHVSLALIGILFVTGAAIAGAGVISLVQTRASDPSTVRIETPPARPTPTPTPRPTPPPLAREVPQRIVIESIGVEAPIVTFGLDEEGLPQVPRNGSHVAWYDFSAIPGSGSNAVFAGHVNWERAPAIFADLKGLQVGDTVRLVTTEGDLVYAVSDSFLVDPADPTSLKVMSPTHTDMITLISCGGTWIPDPSERFGGDYTSRVIVRATLVSQPIPLPSTWGF